jgi:hypothetical protein
MQSPCLEQLGRAAQDSSCLDQLGFFGLCGFFDAACSTRDLISFSLPGLGWLSRAHRELVTILTMGIGAREFITDGDGQVEAHLNGILWIFFED